MPMRELLTRYALDAGIPVEEFLARYNLAPGPEHGRAASRQDRTASAGDRGTKRARLAVKTEAEEAGAAGAASAPAGLPDEAMEEGVSEDGDREGVSRGSDWAAALLGEEPEQATPAEPAAPSGAAPGVPNLDASGARLERGEAGRDGPGTGAVQAGRGRTRASTSTGVAVRSSRPGEKLDAPRPKVFTCSISLVSRSWGPQCGEGLCLLGDLPRASKPAHQ